MIRRIILLFLFILLGIASVVGWAFADMYFCNAFPGFCKVSKAGCMETDDCDMITQIALVVYFFGPPAAFGVVAVILGRHRRTLSRWFVIAFICVLLHGILILGPDFSTALSLPLQAKLRSE